MGLSGKWLISVEDDLGGAWSSLLRGVRASIAMRTRWLAVWRYLLTAKRGPCSIGSSNITPATGQFV